MVNFLIFERHAVLPKMNIIPYLNILELSFKFNASITHRWVAFIMHDYQDVKPGEGMVHLLGWDSPDLYLNSQKIKSHMSQTRQSFSVI